MKFISATTVALYCSAVLLGACATTPPPPTIELARAKAAIEQAQAAGAREYSTEYLNASIKKMEMADAANAKGKSVEATRYVQESYADAHLALVSTQSAKSAKAAADVDQSIQTLQHEANRAPTP
jgi:Domain of unknown function (DUF4398)